MKIWIIIVCAALIVILYLVLKLQFIKYENRMTSSYMDMMDEMNQFIMNRVEMTRRFRHDLKNHIMTIDLLMQQDADDGLDLNVIDRQKLISCYETAKASRFCKDEYVDTIVGMKADYCSDNDIPIEIDIENTVFPQVDTLSMASIIYNLLDNAVEASLEIEDPKERKIRFAMKHIQEGIDILCENRIKTGKMIDFRTRKSDKALHGLGMKIIRTAVEKYDGAQALNVDKKEGLVSIHITLKTDHEFRALA